MKILDRISYFFTGYTDFSGRCPRPLFWTLAPIWLLAFAGVTFLSMEFNGWLRQALFWGFLLATLVPFISLIVRRLHDFNMPGVLVLGLFPLAVFGGFWICLADVLIIGCIPATRGTNKYGDDARGGNVSVFD